MIVHKFGGTSLEDGVRIRAAAELVREAGTPMVVVVSAMAGVTDALQGLADAARSGSPSPDAPCDELARRHLAALGSLAEGGGAGDAAPGRGPDSAAGRAPSWTGGALTEAGSAGRTAGEAIEERIAGLREALAAVAPEGPEAPDPLGIHEVLAAGEDLSVILMVRALSLLGIDAVGVDARSVIRTDASSGAAVPRDQETWDLVRGRLGPLLQAGRTPVLQGFVGATAEGRTTTLGRGGSDFTAAIVGAVLDAREVVIWTDVDGIFSADPRVADDARILPEMGYEEAVELAYFGAKVVHPAAAKHAVARDVTLRIRNALRPGAVGTRIRCDVREARGVAAVAYKRSVTLISVRSLPLFMAHGFLARVFGVLAGHGLPVDLVATSHTSTAFTVDREEELDQVLEELAEFAEVETTRGLAAVSVVGRGLLERPGIVARVLAALGDTPVHLVSQASDVSLNLLVEEAVAPGVVSRIHDDLVRDAAPEPEPAGSGREAREGSGP